MTKPAAICRRLLLQLASRACFIDFTTAGITSDARIANPAITTSSSMSVKPRRHAAAPPRRATPRTEHMTRALAYASGHERCGRSGTVDCRAGNRTCQPLACTRVQAHPVGRCSAVRSPRGQAVADRAQPLSRPLIDSAAASGTARDGARSPPHRRPHPVRRPLHQATRLRNVGIWIEKEKGQTCARLLSPALDPDFALTASPLFGAPDRPPGLSPQGPRTIFC